MAGEEYQRILVQRLHAQVRWENQPADDWTVADLDHGQIILTVEEAIRRGRMEDPGTRSPFELLRGLNLLLHDGSLTRAAVVLFGSSVRLEAEFTQCMLRVARFRGATRTEFLDNRQFRGHAFELLRLGSRFLRESLPVAGRVLPGVFARVDEPMYPPEALREAIANAICHRDYSIGGGSIAIGVYDEDDDRRRVRRDLAQLRGLGLAVTTGHGRGARWWLAAGALRAPVQRGSKTIESINVIDEGTPAFACRAGRASASQLIREQGERDVALEYRDVHKRARMLEEALHSHGGHWDLEGDLAKAFLRCFDEELRRSLGYGSA